MSGFDFVKLMEQADEIEALFNDAQSVLGNDVIVDPTEADEIAGGVIMGAGMFPVTPFTIFGSLFGKVKEFIDERLEKRSRAKLLGCYKEFISKENRIIEEKNKIIERLEAEIAALKEENESHNEVIAELKKTVEKLTNVLERISAAKKIIGI